MQEKKVQNGMLMTVVVYLSLSGASVYHGMKYGLPLYGITANVLVSLILATVLVRYVKYSQTKNNQTVQDSVGFLLLFVLVNFMMYGTWRDCVFYIVDSEYYAAYRRV